MQHQTRHKIFKLLDRFLTRFKILGHINEGNTMLQILRGNTTLRVKLQIDAILKFDIPSKKKENSRNS